jgi:pyruvate dehydrogenase E1 component
MGRHQAGQHIELGIAENNLFLMLAALGLAGDLFGTRLFPIGTVYDPFIARGLDALNYACYQDARFLLVATPSGVTLGPEGGAHQSINPPLIALGQPGLSHYEPAFADELALFMEEAFRLIQAPDGESVYLRLTTRTIRQESAPAMAGRRTRSPAAIGFASRPTAPRRRSSIRRARPRGARRLGGAEGRRARPRPARHHLARPPPPRLERAAARALGREGAGSLACRAVACAGLAPTAGLVTLLDAAPASLSWLGGVMGHRVSPLGVDRFGQTGTLPDLYREYRLDVDAIVEAAAELFLD